MTVRKNYSSFFCFVFSVISNSTGEEVFCWTEPQKSLVKGAFYWGYIFLQIPGGRLSEVFGTKRVLGLSSLVCALLTLITPGLCTGNVWVLILNRVAIGLAQGVLFPSLNPMMIR